MRHVIAWHQVTTYSAEIEVTLPDLATWAIQHAPFAMLDAAGSTLPTPATLVRSLEANPHLRAALLQLLARETGQARQLRDQSRQVG